MTQDATYDVAVIGYGPTGATAANLLGQLGLNVVVIERDPDVYGRARAMFLAVRAQALDTLTPAIRDLAPGLTDAQVHQLATYGIAGADGLFIAKEIAGDSVDLPALFEMHFIALYDSAVRMIADTDTP